MVPWCTLVTALPIVAQVRKAGLWEMTTTQTWQQSPFPPGMNLPPQSAANSPFGGGTHTTQVCLTQQQIEKYGTIVPQTSGCQVSNLVKSSDGVKAEMICTGRMEGKGTFESTSLDPDHAKGKVHFAGSIHMGQNTKPVEFTTESSSVYKGPDCGTVKPFAMPDK